MKLLSGVVYFCTGILLVNIVYLFFLNKKKKISTTDVIIPLNSLFITLLSNFIIWYDSANISKVNITGNPGVFIFNIINIGLFLLTFFYYLNKRSENIEIRKRMSKDDIKREGKIVEQMEKKEKEIRKTLKEENKEVKEKERQNKELEKRQEELKREEANLEEEFVAEEPVVEEEIIVEEVEEDKEV